MLQCKLVRKNITDTFQSKLCEVLRERYNKTIPIESDPSMRRLTIKMLPVNCLL